MKMGKNYLPSSETIFNSEETLTFSFENNIPKINEQVLKWDDGLIGEHTMVNKLKLTVSWSRVLNIAFYMSYYDIKETDLLENQNGI